MWISANVHWLNLFCRRFLISLSSYLVLSHLDFLTARSIRPVVERRYVARIDYFQVRPLLRRVVFECQEHNLFNSGHANGHFTHRFFFRFVAVEDQCINRIHRIGQTAKRVFVRKFYVADSIEERIIELQRRKKNIASTALSDHDGMDASSSNRPSLDDFKLLFQKSCDDDDVDENMNLGPCV